jgi:hypothetical protein
MYSVLLNHLVVLIIIYDIFVEMELKYDAVWEPLQSVHTTNTENQLKQVVTVLMHLSSTWHNHLFHL